MKIIGNAISMLNFAEIDKLKMIPAAKNFNLFINKIENANKLGKEVGEILKTKSNNSYKK